MLEPDVTLTDFVLAVQCSAFCALLLYRRGGDPNVRRLYAALFGSLAVSSFFGGLWHGLFSDSYTMIGRWVWFCVMAALALSAALLWLIAAAILSPSKWARTLRTLAGFQLATQLSVLVFLTDNFAAAAIGLLPPLAIVIAGCIAELDRTGNRLAWFGLAGFVLAALAGLIIVLDISLHPHWATTYAVYHAIQFVAFWLVFLSVPFATSQEQ